jgi:hypothetical protein
MTPITRRQTMIFIGCATLIAVLLPRGGDFDYFYRAGHALSSGQSPYAVVPGYLNPLHVALWFAPLAILPVELAFRLHAGIAFAACLLAFWKYSSGRHAVFLLAMLSPFPYFTASYGNIEYLPLLAPFAPPWLGILLAMTKPQMGLICAGLIGLEAFRSGGVSRAIKTSLPTGVILAISLLLGMNFSALGQVYWNMSLWPVVIPVGLFLAIRGLQRRQYRPALAAGPLLSPYVNPASWVAVWPLFMTHWTWAVGALLGFWLYVGWVMLLAWAYLTGLVR